MNIPAVTLSANPGPLRSSYRSTAIQHRRVGSPRSQRLTSAAILTQSPPFDRSKAAQNNEAGSASGHDLTKFISAGAFAALKIALCASVLGHAPPIAVSADATTTDQIADADTVIVTGTPASGVSQFNSRPRSTCCPPRRSTRAFRDTSQILTPSAPGCTPASPRSVSATLSPVPTTSPSKMLLDGFGIFTVRHTGVEAGAGARVAPASFTDPAQRDADKILVKRIAKA